VIGPLILTLQQAQRGTLTIVPGREAARVCAAHVGYEWMEVLRPRGAPGQLLQRPSIASRRGRRVPATGTPRA
jgi:hypothetical protein